MNKSENLDLDSKSSIKFRKENEIKPLTLKKKVILVFIFIIGLPLSFPTVLPAGLICATILLFQKNKKAVKLGYYLIILQALIIIFYFNFYGVTVT